MSDILGESYMRRLSDEDRKDIKISFRLRRELNEHLNEFRIKKNLSSIGEALRLMIRQSVES